jgi:hypothetical protein
MFISSNKNIFDAFLVFIFQFLQILPNTLQSHLIVGVLVVTLLVLVTSSFVWCVFYFVIKFTCCKMCSRQEREAKENIEMGVQQQQQQNEQQQQPEQRKEGKKHTLPRTLPPIPEDQAADQTRNGEMLNLIKFKVSISKFQLPIFH